MSELMKIFKDNKVVNWHEHVWFDKNKNLNARLLDEVVKMARATYTDIIVCSNPVLAFDCSPELFTRCNDILYEAMQQYPDLIKGMCFVNPGYIKESLKEIDRCINELGFIGVKLYNHYFISDPIMDSLIEKCIELDVPILVHACKLNFYGEAQPFASHGTHFAKAAKKYPKAVFIHAHIGGGGDWHWALKEIAPYDNIFVDIGGSVNDEGIIEETVKYVGIDRVLYGTDMSYCGCTGKLLGANLSQEEKIAILNNRTFERYLNGGAK